MAPCTRRGVLAALGGAAGSVGLAGCSSLLDRGGGSATPSPSAAGTATSTGTASATGTATGEMSVGDLQVAGIGADYATLGSEDAAATATLYGGWKCPYTREFVFQQLPGIIDEYVAPGDLTIQFRAVRFQADESWGDDEPRANRAGQAVWHEAPERFPAYVETVFASQPSARTEWATLDQLVEFADRAGVEETARMRQAVADGEYAAEWKTTMDVVSEKGIKGIPRFELGGEITAPILDPGATDRQLARTLD